MFHYEHAGLADVTSTIRALGVRIGRASEASAVAATIERDIAACARGSRASRGRALRWFSAASLARSATSMPAPASASCTTCSRRRAARIVCRRETPEPAGDDRNDAGARAGRDHRSACRRRLDAGARRGRNAKSGTHCRLFRPFGRAASTCSPTIVCRSLGRAWATPFGSWPTCFIPRGRSTLLARGLASALASAQLAEAPSARRRPPPRLGRAHTGAGPAMKVLLSWSSGKDSAWALHVLRQAADVEVAALLTTFNEAAIEWPCMRCAARSSKRRPQPRDCHSSRSRFPHRVRTRSTRSGCATPSRTPSPRDSRTWHLAISS